MGEEERGARRWRGRVQRVSREGAAATDCCCCDSGRPQPRVATAASCAEKPQNHCQAWAMSGWKMTSDHNQCYSRRAPAGEKTVRGDVERETAAAGGGCIFSC